MGFPIINIHLSICNLILTNVNSIFKSSSLLRSSNILVIQFISVNKLLFHHAKYQQSILQGFLLEISASIISINCRHKGLSLVKTFYQKTSFALLTIICKQKVTLEINWRLCKQNFMIISSEIICDTRSKCAKFEEYSSIFFLWPIENVFMHEIRRFTNNGQYCQITSSLNCANFQVQTV